MIQADNVVIGAGPAGLAAAALAPGGAMVLEARREPGWKILVSGGGRCNVTNTYAPDEFLARVRGGRFLKPAVHGFGPKAIRSFLAEHGCPTVVREDGHVYPKSNKAEDVLTALLDALGENGSEVFAGARVTGIRRTETGFALDVKGDQVLCRRLLVAAGSPAADRPRPDLDAILARLGHTVRPWVAALAPVVLADNPLRGLEGLSFCGRLNVSGRWRESDEVLITNDGLSGPAVLDASAEINRRVADDGGHDFLLDTLPGLGREETVALFTRLREGHPKAAVDRALEGVLPKRLAARLVEIAEAAGGRPGGGRETATATASQLSREERDRLVETLHALPLRAATIAPLSRAYAASGGVPLEEVNARTLESKSVPGLYFAGEILDYDAPTGGFNMTIALATGRLVAASWAAQG
jgi:hypothetical protein